jgi:hypothetical protein
MSSASLQSLLSSATAGDDAAPISAMPVRRPLSAMQVGADPANGSDLVYLGEVPIDFLAIPRTITDAASTSHHWLRFEIMIERSKGFSGQRYDVLIAEHPYAMKRVHHAPFKTGMIRGRPAPEDIFASLGAAIQWVDALDQDYFYTGKDLIAAISQPQAMLDSGNARNLPKNALFVFGVCVDLPRCEALLYQTPIVQRLLKQTEDRTIRFAPSGSYSIQPQLPEELSSEGNALIFMAIRQALAGPHKDSEAWIGKPVTDKINHIYRDHLYNEWRRYQDDVISDMPLDEQKVAGDAGDDSD